VEAARNVRPCQLDRRLYGAVREHQRDDWRRQTSGILQRRRKDCVRVSDSKARKRPAISSKRRRVDQRCDQPKKSLLLRSVRPTTQEITEFDVRQTSPGGSIWLMDDEGATILRFATQVPRVPTCTSVKFSALSHRLKTRGFGDLAYTGSMRAAARTSVLKRRAKRSIALQYSTTAQI
jgi:hypothetical protein